MSERKPTPALCLDFPLRPNFMAQVIVPRDMTEPESRRLVRFIEALTRRERQEQEAKA